MATQTFHCVLCQESFTSVAEFTLHEKEPGHRLEFERRMDSTSVGLLLCKCCFVTVPDLRNWEDHIKSKGHIKLVGQADYLGKKCVWDVPGMKMSDGSIKLCKDIAALMETGWKDPEYTKKLDIGKLETDVVIGMNCVSVKSTINGNPVYYCTLCSVDFHHNDRHHLTGRQHRINVIWNWEKKTADRISAGLEFPKPSTRAKAQAELQEVTKKIFHLEQECLNEKQYEIYRVVTSKILPVEMGRSSQPRVRQLEPEPAPCQPPPPEEPRFSGSSAMPKFKAVMPAAEPADDMPAEVRAELNLFTLMEELQESGGFNPPPAPVDPIKLLNMLHALGEGLLEYQTKKREIPMELPRDQIQAVSKCLSSIESRFQRLTDKQNEVAVK